MDEFAGLVLDDLLDSWMVVTDVDLSVIRLQVNVSVSLVVVEILQVSLTDNQGCLVMGLVDVGEVFESLGDNLFSVANEGARIVGGGREAQRGEKTSAKTVQKHDISTFE